MKIKIIILFILIFSTMAHAEITKEQDIRNKIFLRELDENIIETINVLRAFNETANSMSDKILNSTNLKKFLLDMTMECAKIRKKIRETDGLNATDREIDVRLIIASIRSDIDYSYPKISNEQDKKNISELKEYLKGLSKSVAMIRAAIIKEEMKIDSEEKVTEKYLDLQAHQFLFSLLIDFISINEYLSPQNRDLLTNITRKIGQSVLK